MTQEIAVAERIRAVASLVTAATWLCVAVSAMPVAAATVSDKAKESGCVSKPVVVAGTTYSCYTESGVKSYFNVPGAAIADPVDTSARKSASMTPSPAGFPKIDSATQKGRDEMRRKVLSDELATESALLVEARAAYADGAPASLPEERANVEKYRERIAKLRQAVSVHEKNVEALKKELAAGK
jgi:hypothetical protein